MTPRLIGLCAGLALLTGCSFTTMSPAHKLARGEVVVQGGFDEPGFLYIPRLSGAMTFGTGGADFGFHVGTTAATVNAGGTARAYLGDWALSLQGDMAVTTFQDSLFSGNQRFGFITANPRFGRILSSDRQHLYGGFQLVGLVPYNVDQSFDLPSRPGVAAGAYIGFAWDSPGNVDLQAELSAAPIGVFPGVYTEDDTYGFGVVPIAQFGVSVQYRKERDRKPAAPSAPPRGNAPIL